MDPETSTANLSTVVTIDIKQQRQHRLALYSVALYGTSSCAREYSFSKTG